MGYSESEVVPEKEQAACRGGPGVGMCRLQEPGAAPESENPRRPWWVWLAGNAGRCLIATCVLAASLVGAPARAQDRPESGETLPAGPPVAEVPKADPEAPPSPTESIRAFNLVQAWILAADVPEVPDAAAIPRAAAASVVLRQDGEVMGRGADSSDDGLAVWRAARAAWAEAAGRLGVERDALMQTSLKEAASGLAISVELAGSLTPMLGEAYADMAADIDPGLTGLAVRAGERSRAVFPATMLAMGLTPDEAFATALLDLFGSDQSRVMNDRLGLVAPATLRQREGVAFLKFRVSHVAQTSAGAAPIFLHRCGVEASVSRISVPGLRSMADGMARHLVGRAWPGPDGYGMFGRLNPATGKYDPRFADSGEQAGAALALRRYSRMRGVEPTTAEDAARLARDLLAALARVERDERAPWIDPASAAMSLVAYFEGGRPEAGEEVGAAGLVQQCAGAVNAAFDVGSGFTESMPPGARGLVAWALVRLAKDSGDGAARSKAEAAVRAAYASVTPEMLVGQMPWLGWAELELAGPGDIPAAVALRDLRALIWKHQLRADDLAPEDTDLQGGIVFTKSRTPLPGWNSARALAFLATMLGDERLTPPAERGGEVVRLVEGMRFIRQLVVNEPAAFMFKGPAKRTLGGVRSAPWDIRMPPDATSVSLLAVCEMLRSLDSASEAGAGAR